MALGDLFGVKVSHVPEKEHLFPHYRNRNSFHCFLRSKFSKCFLFALEIFNTLNDSLKIKFFLQICHYLYFLSCEAGTMPMPTLYVPHTNGRRLQGRQPKECWIMFFDCAFVPIIISHWLFLIACVQRIIGFKSLTDLFRQKFIIQGVQRVSSCGSCNQIRNLEQLQ